ncbi:hypothetical protein [uncultured Ruegeria sp.]|uniref:LIC10280 family protein n=1 Tax=uncultured Ruegeria sp. TaxID=259304 RepID=UPI00260D21E4|nr:hypothetical protein [uncultured Ruegeria sp.]
MNRRTLITVLTLAGTVVFPLQAFAGDTAIAGSYSVQGRNVDGQPYSGSANVSQDGSFVSIVWTVAGETFNGAGAIDGKVVTVEWNAEFPIVYVVAPDGELHGTWADGLALDKLTPQ